MGTPFLGELKLFPYDIPIQGWAKANGQFLPINQNQALFSLFGTMYGGNGQTTFALPDLRGRIPLHVGGSFNVQGQASGQEFHTITMSEMPAHTHFMIANNNNADTDLGTGNSLGSFNNGYAGPANLTTQLPPSVSNVGGSQPHENRQPFLVMNWMVALIGVFPSRN